jgi:hypothetical protein
VALPQFIAGLDERRALGNACVVDEYVNNAQIIFDISKRTRDAFLIGNITDGVHRSNLAFISYLFGDALYLLLGSGNHSHACALARKRKGDGASDAASAPCNESDSVGKLHKVLNVEL